MTGRPLALLTLLALGSCASTTSVDAPPRDAADVSFADLDATLRRRADQEPTPSSAVRPLATTPAPLTTTVRIAPAAEPARRRSGRRINVDLHRASLAQALQLLADEAHLNLVLGEGLTGEVSLSLRHVDPLEVLDSVVASRGLVAEQQGSILVVRRR